MESCLVLPSGPTFTHEYYLARLRLARKLLGDGLRAAVIEANDRATRGELLRRLNALGPPAFLENRHTCRGCCLNGFDRFIQPAAHFCKGIRWQLHAPGVTGLMESSPIDRPTRNPMLTDSSQIRFLWREQGHNIRFRNVPKEDA